MIFAKVDVKLPRSHRFMRIPRGSRRAAAIGVFLVAVCYTRDEELDGFVPEGALEDVATPESVSDLVRVGLLVPACVDGSDGFHVHNYASKNETKEQISSRRNATSERVARFRKRSGNGVTDDPVTLGCNASVPGSGSDSLSVSVVSDQGGAGGGRPSTAGVLGPPPADIPVTDDIRAQCAMAGARPPGPEHVAACLANARSKSHISADWGAVLVAWMIRQKGYDSRPRDSPRYGGPPKQLCDTADLADWTQGKA